MMLKRYLLLTACIWQMNPIHADSIKVISIMDFNSSNVSQAQIIIISDYLTSYLKQYSNIIIIDRETRETLLREIEFSTSPLSEDISALRIGKLLSADHVIIGSVSLEANSYYITMKLLSVESGAVDKIESERYLSFQSVLKYSRLCLLRLLSLTNGLDSLSSLSTEKVHEENQAALSSTMSHFVKGQESQKIIIDLGMAIGVRETASSMLNQYGSLVTAIDSFSVVYLQSAIGYSFSNILQAALVLGFGRSFYEYSENGSARIAQDYASWLASGRIYIGNLDDIAVVLDLGYAIAMNIFDGFYYSLGISFRHFIFEVTPFPNGAYFCFSYNMTLGLK